MRAAYGGFDAVIARVADEHQAVIGVILYISEIDLCLSNHRFSQWQIF